jgi:type IV secretion system protein VirB6
VPNKILAALVVVLLALAAEPAFAQSSTSTVFGGLLQAILSALQTAITGPIQRILSYVAGPAATLAAVYVIAFSILVMTGRITGGGDAFVRMVKLGVIGLVIGGSPHYQNWVVQPFLIGGGGVLDGIVNALGGSSGVNAVDALWAQTSDTMTYLQGLMSWTAPGTSVAAGFMICVIFSMGVGCCCIAFVETALAQVGLAMVLMVGPLFIMLALFDLTRRWFFGWAGEVIHYGVTYILLVVAGTLVNSLAAYLVGKVGAPNTGTFATLLVMCMYNGIGLVVSVFIFLQAGKIARAISAGGSASSGLAAAAGWAMGRLR